MTALDDVALMVFGVCLFRVAISRPTFQSLGSRMEYMMWVFGSLFVYGIICWVAIF